jgi:hypothetical protein
VVDQVVSVLANEGKVFPPGWVVLEAKVSTGGGASTKPTPGGGGTVKVDPKRIKKMFPSLTENQANLPGVIYVFLLHEYYHAIEAESGSGSNGSGSGGGAGGGAPNGGSPPYNTKPGICGDIQLIPGVAMRHCDLATAVVATGGNADALCKLYKEMRKNYNNGRDGKGGASKKHADSNCPGTYPGDIPECEACSTP